MRWFGERAIVTASQVGGKDVRGIVEVGGASPRRFNEEHESGCGGCGQSASERDECAGRSDHH